MIRLPIITDNCVPDEIGDYIHDRYGDVIRVRDPLTASAQDEPIRYYAIKRRLILVTFDKDFRNHAKVAMQSDTSTARSWGLILLDYPKPHNERHLKTWIEEIEREYSICALRHPDTMLVHVEVAPRRLTIFR